MFCPRCGRPVNPEANFCGGCGLSKVEIEKYLQKTAPQQPQTQAAPQPEMPNAEPVIIPVTEPAAEVKTEPAAPKAEAVFSEPAEVKAEAAQPKSVIGKMIDELEAEGEVEYVDSEVINNNNCTYAYSYKKSESDTANTANSTNTAGSTDPQYGYANAQFTQAPQNSADEVKKEAPLSTVDFIWMFVISSLPLIGLIYIIYLAVQDNNTNKRSFARATIIVSIFSIVICLLFMVGVVAAGLI